MAKEKTRRKRAGVNKSQKIRDYLAKNGNAKPKEIIEALGAKGVTVSAALVSAVKYGGKAKKTKKGVRRTKATSMSAADLLQAKELADQLGGVDKAKAALETLEKLR